MLSLTRKTDYALVALAFLCQRQRDDEGAVSARYIAQRFGLPLALLMNVLKQLGQARIVKSTRGANGGYELAVDPQALSIHEVILAIEGPVKFTQCSDGLPILGQGCEVDNCPIRQPIRSLHERIVAFLEHVTLADLFDRKVEQALDAAPDASGTPDAAGASNPDKPRPSDADSRISDSTDSALQSSTSG